MGEVVGGVVDASGDLLVEFFVTGGFEGEVAAEEGEHEDAGGPDVGGGAEVLFFLDDFGGHVGGGAAEDFEAEVGAGAAAEPEVEEFDLGVGVDDDVFELYISMGHILTMQIDQDTQQLFYD